MSKYKMMYKIMYDDLKDADMIIGYAYELKEDGCKELADKMAQNAKERSEHFMNYHQTFVNEAKKDENAGRIDDKHISDCLWDITHDNLSEWKEKIDKCIKEY